MNLNSNNRHEILEKNIGLLAILIILAISLGAFVEIIPLIFQKQITEPIQNLRPYTALELEGRDIYIREGCNVCHSQMIRPFRSETERYGHYSLAGESVWEHPFLWGSKRTGPDLARIGQRYSDTWHRLHLLNPRQLIPESNMPAFPWLEKKTLDSTLIKKKLKIFKNKFDVPYTDEQISNAQKELEGKTEMDAIIAYLQSLGHGMR
ncbi:cytochrome c oxidase subunit [Candidatus Photodesmus katoptron]|uniref:Cytochrome c oxidase, cbb3-type, subunit II n=1 Tax=Candidatus Photodesmus katoptron Akat1 TaxID=1236703 RepID=S3DKD1_9GAMM|nr:cytochrome-c oxidase, cbb3-type subunit II [Candidatus Photodesmus katoptron]EPE37594.1 cytochrome c oxidase, cbb3-type, subunit II [Candidatus Photodesmus katoptron Akat1]KEY90689.1 cytochrome c oxidase subunit [Candidatus Photodesmus katoptron]